MCGIFGIFQQDRTVIPDPKKLQASSNSLHHRGPDAHEIYSNAGIGLAHTRLSLIDLNPRSNQPFWDNSRRYVLVYNGEIYNFQELRQELEARGVKFHTTSDTEVLLHSLIHYSPEDILPRLNGMFAFGFYDTQKHTLLLARDRFGMKPLYYSEDNSSFIFGSEIKSLRPWIGFEADPLSISSYLLGFGGPTKGFTFYKQIKALRPGDYITLQPGTAAQIESFFTLPDFWDRNKMAELDSLSPKQAVDRMEELMWNSVERQLFADSQVGVFCSGGVDSSLILAMAAKMRDNFSIFHANVVGPWSEVGAARALSEHLKLDLNVVEVQEQDFIKKLPDVMRQYEHPYTYHPNCAPFMMVSRLVREQGVKGMLSGEGSDELFLGYPWLGRQKIVDAYYAQIANLRTLIRKIPGIGPIIWPYEGDRPTQVRDLLNRGEVADDKILTRQAAGKLAWKLDKKQVTSIDYMHYHLRTLLHRNDCLGMEASIEARFPFLDHDVVSTAVNLPPRYKLRASPWVFEKAHPFIRDKWVIREVANRWMPNKLSQRIKIGFWTTVFQRMEVSPRYFDNSYVRELFELSKNNMRTVIEDADQDLRMRLLHLDVWAHVCLYQQPLQTSTDKLMNEITIRPQ